MRSFFIFHNMEQCFIAASECRRSYNKYISDIIHDSYETSKKKKTFQLHKTPTERSLWRTNITEGRREV